jgi:hypothetical protein
MRFQNKVINEEEAWQDTPLRGPMCHRLQRHTSNSPGGCEQKRSIQGANTREDMRLTFRHQLAASSHFLEARHRFESSYKIGRSTATHDFTENSIAHLAAVSANLAQKTWHRGAMSSIARSCHASLQLAPASISATRSLNKIKPTVAKATIPATLLRYVSCDEEALPLI